jgi:hypothetical protein
VGEPLKRNVRQLPMPLMRSIILVILLTASAGSIFGRKRGQNSRLTQTHPSVYITFERAGKIAADSTHDLQEKVWLRLRNNTRWAIILDMNGVSSREYGDAALFHDVLLAGKVIREERCHVCSFNRLLPVRSLVFTVPREDLRPGYSIRVKFSYGWENGDDVFGGREVDHFFYFHNSKLPKSLSSAALSNERLERTRR